MTVSADVRLIPSPPAKMKVLMSSVFTNSDQSQGKTRRSLHEGDFFVNV